MELIKNNFKLSKFGESNIAMTIKSYYYTIYISTPFFYFLNFLIAYRFTLNIGINLNFVVIFSLTSLISTILTILIPMRAIKKYKCIVHQIYFKNEIMYVHTFKSNIELRCSKRTGVETFKMKDGEHIGESFQIENTHTDIFVIASLFDNKEELTNKLINYQIK